MSKSAQQTRFARPRWMRYSKRQLAGLLASFLLALTLSACGGGGGGAPGGGGATPQPQQPAQTVPAAPLINGGLASLPRYISGSANQDVAFNVDGNCHTLWTNGIQVAGPGTTNSRGPATVSPLTTIKHPLLDGINQFSSQCRNKAGEAGNLSEPYSFVYDNTAPTAPSLGAPIANTTINGTPFMPWITSSADEEIWGVINGGQKRRLLGPGTFTDDTRNTLISRQVPINVVAGQNTIRLWTRDSAGNESATYFDLPTITFVPVAGTGTATATLVASTLTPTVGVAMQWAITVSGSGCTGLVFKDGTGTSQSYPCTNQTAIPATYQLAQTYQASVDVMSAAGTNTYFVAIAAANGGVQNPVAPTTTLSVQGGVTNVAAGSSVILNYGISGTCTSSNLTSSLGGVVLNTGCASGSITRTINAGETFTHTGYNGTATSAQAVTFTTTAANPGAPTVSLTAQGGVTNVTAGTSVTVNYSFGLPAGAACTAITITGTDGYSNSPGCINGSFTRTINGAVTYTITGFNGALSNQSQLNFTVSGGGGGILPTFQSAPILGAATKLVVSGNFLYVLDGNCVQQYDTTNGHQMVKTNNVNNGFCDSKNGMNGTLNNPAGFAACPNNQIAILSQNRVHLFDQNLVPANPASVDLQLASGFTTKGFACGQDANNAIVYYVGDTGNNRISAQKADGSVAWAYLGGKPEALTVNGQTVTAIFSDGTAGTQIAGGVKAQNFGITGLTSPKSILWSATKGWYLIAQGNDTISVRDAQGNAVSTGAFGTSGASNGQLSGPTDVAEKNGAFYIANRGNNRTDLWQ